VVNSVKGFGDINKQSTDRLPSIHCTTPRVKNCNKNVVSGLAFEYTNLIIGEVWLNLVEYPRTNE
jgi:hypothetical protein